MKLRIIILKIINRLILKNKLRVYFVPHNNGKIDKYDLLNYTADNILTLLNYLIENKIDLKSKMYVECYSRERLACINDFLKDSNLRIVPVLSDNIVENQKPNKIRKLKNRLIRYTCKTWISCTPFAGFSDIVKGQVFICLSYSTPLKSGISLYHYDLSYMTHFLETSLLTATVHSAQYRNLLYRCPILGFPRNDNLFVSAKSEAVVKWINSSIDFEYKKIIVYAPTYRDYDGAYDNKNALGYDNVDKLEEFLSNNDFLLIVKYHPLQKVDNTKFTKHILLYEKTYDFTLYDLLSISDLLISDYSSVVHDYIITGKPIVINAFDLDNYDLTRGFAFEPIDYICPSPKCDTLDKLEYQIIFELNSSKRSQKYYEVQKMFHRYIDGKSCERVFAFLTKYIH